MADKEQLTIDLTLKADDKYKSEVDKVVSDTVKKVTDANKTITESENEKATRIAATTKLLKEMDEVNSSASKRAQQMRQAEVQAQNNLNASINNTASSIKNVEEGLKNWLGITLTEEYKAANGMTSLGDAASTTKNEVDSLNTTLRQTATDVKNISNESSKITKLYKGRWAAGNIRKIASSVAGYMDAGDEAGTAGQLVEGVAGIASSTMIGYSVAGPAGAVVGGLTKAGTLLIDAAAEQKAAAFALMRTTADAQNVESSQYNSKANELLNKRSLEYIRDEYKYEDVEDLKNIRYKLQNALAEEEKNFIDLNYTNQALQNYNGWTEADQKAKVDSLSRLAASEQRQTDYKNRLSILDEIIGLKDSNYAEGIKEQATRAKQKAKEEEKAAKEEEKAEKAAQKAAEAAQKIKDAKSLKDARMSYRMLGKEKNDIESELTNINRNALNYNLTDSLTKIGGGSGYYGQMNGVYSSVTNIQKTLQTKLNEITSKMDILTKNNPNLGATYG